MSKIEPIRPADDGAQPSVRIRLAEQNGVPLSIAQLTTARHILGALADDFRWDSTARRAALLDGMGESEIVTQAIKAKLVALRKWDLHDPDRLLAQLHLMDAATIAPLIETEHGLGFGDDSFAELVAFIAELPW